MIKAKKGKIEAARSAQGWSQKALAKASGVSAPRICAIETNGSYLTPQTAHKICVATGKKFNELFDIIPAGNEPKRQKGEPETSDDAKQLRQPCAVCRNHKGGKPIRIRDDHGTLFEATHIAHCPYCGRYLKENYEKEAEK